MDNGPTRRKVGFGCHGPEVPFWEMMGLPSPAALALYPAPISVTGVYREESAAVTEIALPSRKMDPKCGKG
jgi:hypothetical protein